MDIRARSLVSHPFVRVAFVSFFPTAHTSNASGLYDCCVRLCSPSLSLSLSLLRLFVV